MRGRVVDVSILSTIRSRKALRAHIVSATHSKVNTYFVLCMVPLIDSQVLLCYQMYISPRNERYEHLLYLVHSSFSVRGVAFELPHPPLEI